MARNCLEPRCEDCPLNELDATEFTDHDRVDGLRVVQIMAARFVDQKDSIFSEADKEKLERDAQNNIGAHKGVSEIAVRALERQVTGTCETLEEGVN